MSISIGQLDLEALKNYLKIVQGFRTVNDPSGDTEHVNGIPSELIAIVAQVENEVAQSQLGRTTVNNALNLVKVEGESVEYISGSDVLTEEEGKQLKNAALAASTHTSNDMRSLRNEMYHLKRDMIKTGAVPFDQVYNGFIDPFLGGLDLYEKATLEVDNIVNDEVFCKNGDVGSYDEGQYVALKNNEDLLSIEPVKYNNVNTSSLAIGSGHITLLNTLTEISKSYGVYNKGRFVFGNNTQGISALTNNEVNMIYKDGPDRVKVAELNEQADVAGFASTIMVPAGLDENYLKAISISLRVLGMPGYCQLELFQYNEEGNYGDPIAISNRLDSSSVTTNWYNYKFTFNNPILLEKGAMYLLVLKAINTDAYNLWYVGGFTELCNDAKHQDTYTLSKLGKFKKQSPDIITNQVHDMFMGLYTSETQPAKLNYSSKGIYTGLIELENSEASRVRVAFNPRKDENEQYYNVIVKGITSDGKIVPGEFVEKLVYYKHNVWADAEKSGSEFAFDFTFDQYVKDIEFQIIFNSPNGVGEETYEALYSVVVSTDTGLIEGV